MLLILQGWASLIGLLGAALLGSALESLTDSRAVSFWLAGIALGAFGWVVSRESTVMIGFACVLANAIGTAKGLTDMPEWMIKKDGTDERRSLFFGDREQRQQERRDHFARQLAAMGDS